MVKTSSPLVTIIVITYNSSKYVQETLDSIRNQTYKNIELIISDDCSSDNTVELCKSWLLENEGYFKFSYLIANSTNRGVAGNSNIGLKKANGKWAKLIAGDDILLSSCIENYINYANNNTAKILFGYPQILLETPDENLQLNRESYYKNNSKFFNLSARKQFLHLLTSDVLPMNPATLFFHVETVNNIGGFDDRYMPEDVPLYLKVTNNGFNLKNIDEYTVGYRIHNSSLTFKGKTNEAVNLYWFEIKKKIKGEYINIHLLKNNPLVYFDYQNTLLWKNLTILFGNNRGVWRKLRFIRLFSPLYIQNKINEVKRNNV